MLEAMEIVVMVSVGGYIGLGLCRSLGNIEVHYVIVVAFLMVACKHTTATSAIRLLLLLHYYYYTDRKTR